MVTAALTQAEVKKETDKFWQKIKERAAKVASAGAVAAPAAAGGTPAASASAALAPPALSPPALSPPVLMGCPAPPPGGASSAAPVTATPLLDATAPSPAPEEPAAAAFRSLADTDEPTAAFCSLGDTDEPAFCSLSATDEPPTAANRSLAAALLPAPLLAASAPSPPATVVSPAAAVAPLAAAAVPQESVPASASPSAQALESPGPVAARVEPVATQQPQIVTLAPVAATAAQQATASPPPVEVPAGEPRAQGGGGRSLTAAEEHELSCGARPPPGWSVALRETAAGRKYKIYSKPGESNTQSLKQAWERHNNPEAAADRGAGRGLTQTPMTAATPRPPPASPPKGSGAVADASSEDDDVPPNTARTPCTRLQPHA